MVLYFALSGGREGEKPSRPPCVSMGARRVIAFCPSLRSLRSFASLLLTIDTAPTDRQGVTPRPLGRRRSTALFLFDMPSCPRAGGRRRLDHAPPVSFRGGFLVVSFPVFCSSGSGLFLRMRPRVPRLPRAGAYDA